MHFERDRHTAGLSGLAPQPSLPRQRSDTTCWGWSDMGGDPHPHAAPLARALRVPAWTPQLSSTSTIASTSTGTLRGSPFTPTADRACLPLSPNTVASRSEHPFTTLG